jgi:hypothetical protein
LCGLLLTNLATVLANECEPGINFIPGRYCDDYFYCSNLDTELTCPDGYWFDMGYQSCLVIELVVCTNNCIDVADGTFLERREAGCGAFWRCHEDRGVPLNCPYGLYFDTTNGGICNYPDALPVPCNSPSPPTIPTVPTVSPTTPTASTAPTIETTLSPPPTPTSPGNFYCAGRHDFYIPYPPNGCGGWQRCMNGIAGTTGTCPNGLYFDYGRQMCNWSDLVVCNL